MDNYIEAEIPLTRLNLDLDNSRYPWSLSSQREIIDWMTSDIKHIGDKVFNLAKDIIEHGLNPLERVLVTSDETGKQYIVLEGNRRITALRLLANPDAAPTDSWKNKYKKLINKSNNQPPKKIPCIIINDIDTAYHFMEVKHLGQLSGVGVVPWESEEKARHQKRRNLKSAEHKALSLLDYVRGSKLYSKKTKDLASSGFPITTLDRLLGDKIFRESIGLTLDTNGNLAIGVDPKEAKKAVTKIILDFGSKQKKVDDVKNHEKRMEYRESFNKNESPNPKKTLKSALSLSALNNKDNKKQVNKSNANKYQNPKDRKYLIITGTSMPIDPKKYNRPRRIFEELKKLPLQTIAGSKQTVFPNAIALLFRSFFEMSIAAFIAEKKLMANEANPDKKSLTEKAKVVVKYTKDHNLLDKNKIKVLNKALADVNKLANPNSLNDFVHNINQIPTPKDLIDIWDTYSDLLTCIWNEIK